MHQRTIGVLVWDGFLTGEVTAPVEVLGTAIAQGTLAETTLVVVSPEARPVTSQEGLRVVADTTIDRCPPLDVLIIPSSASMAPVLADRAILDFVDRQGRTVGTLASNCAGAFLLGAAGLLDERSATTYPGGHDDLRDAVPRAHVLEADVVKDGNLITTSGATASYRGALVLLEELTDASVAQDVADSLALGSLLEGKEAVHLTADA